MTDGCITLQGHTINQWHRMGGLTFPCLAVIAQDKATAPSASPTLIVAETPWPPVSVSTALTTNSLPCRASTIRSAPSYFVSARPSSGASISTTRVPLTVANLRHRCPKTHPDPTTASNWPSYRPVSFRARQTENRAQASEAAAGRLIYGSTSPGS
jgi:hypothetical protein